LTVKAQCLSACLPPSCRHPKSLWLSYQPRVVGIDLSQTNESNFFVLAVMCQYLSRNLCQPSEWHSQWELLGLRRGNVLSPLVVFSLLLQCMVLTSSCSCPDFSQGDHIQPCRVRTHITDGLPWSLWHTHTQPTHGTQGSGSQHTLTTIYISRVASG